jgi:hypothetical protein
MKRRGFVVAGTCKSGEAVLISGGYITHVFSGPSRSCWCVSFLCLVMHKPILLSRPLRENRLLCLPKAMALLILNPKLNRLRTHHDLHLSQRHRQAAPMKKARLHFFFISLLLSCQYPIRSKPIIISPLHPRTVPADPWLQRGILTD